MSKRKKNKPPVPEVDAPYFLIDTHCHLDMDDYSNDLDTVLLSAREHNIKSIISIGIDEKSSIAAVTLAKKYPMVKASIGVHPHDAEHIKTDTYQNLQNLAAANREHIVAYGEIGLDYARNYSEPKIQRKIFTEQLELAQELKLPVIIHDRDAHQDTFDILQAVGPFPEGGVMHCFSGDRDFAEKIINFGLHLSIPGVVTFKNAVELQKIAASMPLESLLLETDGPFLSPVPWRGKRNSPSNLPYTALKVAQLRDISMVELAEQSSKNAQRLFRYKVEQ